MKLNRITALLVALALAGTPVLTHAQGEETGAAGAGAGASAAGAGAGLGAIGGIATGSIVAGAIAAGVLAAVVSNNRSESAINSPTGSVVDPKSTSIATVSFADGVTTVAALAGQITYVDANGVSTKIDIGTGLLINANGSKSTKSLADIVAAEKASGKASNANSVTTALTRIVNQLAANTAKGTYGVNSGALLAAAVKVAGTANPDAAVAYTQTAIAAIAQDKSQTTAQKQAAVAAVAEASLATATTPEQRIALAAAIQQASDQANIASSTAPTGPSAAITTPPVDITIIVPVSPST